MDTEVFYVYCFFCGFSFLGGGVKGKLFLGSLLSCRILNFFHSLFSSTAPLLREAASSSTNLILPQKQCFLEAATLRTTVFQIIFLHFVLWTSLPALCLKFSYLVLDFLFLGMICLCFWVVHASLKPSLSTLSTHSGRAKVGR